VSPLRPFFHLTSAFFGLTYEHKSNILEEIFICTQNLQGFTYRDVLSLPTYERRFFISLLLKRKEKQDEIKEANSENNITTDSKGNRKRKVSGSALKTSIKNGDIKLGD